MEADCCDGMGQLHFCDHVVDALLSPQTSSVSSVTSHHYLMTDTDTHLCKQAIKKYKYLLIVLFKILPKYKYGPCYVHDGKNVEIKNVNN